MERRLAAILAADVVGYSRLMEAYEEGTLARLKALRQDFIDATVGRHNGRIVKLTGDGALVEFPSVVQAVLAAADIQRGMMAQNADVPADRRIDFRVGINLGDVIVDGDDIYGDGVNVAARLEGLAEPGGICVARTVFDHVRNKVDLKFEHLGEHRVKNIAEPVTVYRVVTDPGLIAKTVGPKLASTPGWRLAALAAAVVLALAAGGIWLWRSDGISTVVGLNETTEQAALNKHRVAVLPLVNLSADPENEYFSDGLTEELISKLSRLHDLTVIARTSVMQYKATDKSIAEIGRELQVGTILEGSVRKAGDRLRITAQLVDVASQGHLWSQDYDRQLEDVFAIQSDVAQNVAGALEVTLRPAEKRQLEEQGTQDLEAYNLYLRGLNLYHTQSEEGLKNSITYFERALQHDPSFAQAYAGMAMAYQMLGFTSLVAPREAFEKSKATAEKALELDDTIVDAHVAAATAWQILDYDQQRAKLAYERAVELAPNSAYAHNSYCIQYLSPMGRHEEAIAELRRAVELEPVSMLYLDNLGWIYYMARRYDSAIEYLERSPPGAVDGQRGLGEIYVQKGMYDEAIAAMQKFVELTDSDDYALGYLGYAYGMAGKHDDALEILGALQDRATGQYVPPYAFAPLYVGLGDNDKAIDALWRDYEERASPFLLWLGVFPTFDPLRSNPRFTDLLRKIGVEPQ